MPIFDDYGSKRPRMPSMRGRVVYRVVDGHIRVQAWPRKAGPPKTAEHQFRVDKFRNVAKVIKYIDPEIQRQFREAVAGTPLLPGDLLTAMIYNRLTGVLLPDGTRLYPMPARQDVSASLDAISQLPGYMLIRGEEFWEGIPPGEDGEVLQWQADTGPAWVPGGGLGGGTGIILRNAAVSVPNNNFGFVATFSTVVHADTGYWDAAQPTEIQIPSTGLYIFGANAQFDSNGTGNRWIIVQTTNGTLAHSGPIGGANQRFAVAALMYAAAGDVITCTPAQTSGGTRSCNVNAFWACKVG